jgi:hypothetical protein
MAYLGKMSRATNGASECYEWKNFRGRYPDKYFVHLDGNATFAKNYCRNPKKNDAEKPWCYTSYRGSWHFCDVGTCGKL